MSDVKYKIISDLLSDIEPRLIAASHDVPYTRVLRYNKELKDAKEAGDISSLIDIDAVMLQDLMQQYRDTTPEGLLEAVDEAIGSVTKSKSLLDNLNISLQTAAHSISTQIQRRSMVVESCSELEILSEALCNLQEAFFNPKGTQLNVQNNYVDPASKPYGDFLSDKPDSTP